MRYKVFISSVQSEFARERAQLAAYIRQDALLGTFFDPFLFEEVAACDLSPQGVYLQEVADADLYVGLLGLHYGSRIGGDSAQVPTDFELPEDAVKEAIVNAVCHRDYLDNGGVQVMLFKNRLEILNPGSLPKGWTIRNLIEGHKSRPRNESIALALHMAGYVEKVGTGTRDIIGKCRAKGLKSPEYSSDGDDFGLIIWRNENGMSVGGHGERSPNDGGGGSEGLCGAYDRVHDGHLSMRDRLIRSLIDASKNRRELAEAVGVSRNAGYLKRTLDALLSDEVISYTIPSKPKSRLQRYRLTDKARALIESQVRA